MRVLLDENVPHDLIGPSWGTRSSGSRIRLAGTLNGELLARASGRIDAFVTLDRKLEREHDVARLPFGVVVVIARSSKVADLLPLMIGILDALKNLKPGELARVGAEPLPNSACKRRR